MIREIELQDIERVNALFSSNDMPFLTVEDLTFPFFHCVLYIEEKIIGVLLYKVIYERMELEELVVDQDFRGRGVGTSLMRYLLEEADRYQCSNITLEVCFDNVVAIALYEKFGFVKQAVRPHYYGSLDGYLMMREMVRDGG